VDEDGVRREERRRGTRHLVDPADSPRGHEVAASAQVRRLARVGGDHADVRELELRHHLLEERRLLPGALDERDGPAGAHPRERESRKAGAAAEVGGPEARRKVAERRYDDERKQGVEDVLEQEVRGLDETRQVHALVAPHDRLAEPLEEEPVLVPEPDALPREDLPHG